MSLVTSLVKRRQFLFGAVGSTCALTCKKLAAFAVANGAAASGSPVRAMEAQAASVAASGAGNRCPHLLSPLRIRNVILKNRILHTVSPPHALQGPENYPTDAYRNHYSNMAKNAAIVTLNTLFGTYPKQYTDNGGTDHLDGSWQDIPPVHNYVNRMIDDIHVEGALVSQNVTMGTLGGSEAAGDQGPAPQSAAGAQGGGPGGASGQSGGQGGPGPRTPKPDTQTVQEIVAAAKAVEAQGYDACDLSSTSHEAVEAVRNSTNLILLTHVGPSGPAPLIVAEEDKPLHEWVYERSQFDWQFGKRTSGITNDNKPSKDDIEEVVETSRKLEGLADILWLRDIRNEHPNGFTQDPNKPLNLYYAEAVKKAGIKALTCPSAGFHNPAQNDQFIAGGLTDMVGMATPFFADPEFVKKVSEGRLDDILPCIQCQNCHMLSRTDGPWYDMCAVNPKWATPAYKIQNIPAPTAKRRVAVIGGGVSGMRAAIIASERGHRVTIYERDKVLGGHMQFTDYTQWKWNYRKFKDWLVYQVNKHGVEVLLNTRATPEMIKAKEYDAVLVANGAQPVFSEWETEGAANTFNLIDSYTNKQALGKNVVVIGEGMFSTEAAIGMAKDGHKVMILCPTKYLIELTQIGPHNMMNQVQILENHPNINFELETKVKSIKGNTVTYADSKGAEKTLQADSFVIWSGMKARADEAEKFIGTADQVLFIGDCTGKAGTVQKTQRQAFFMASQL
jgi:2,4-dienoyl-CoA reductase-like NADH-dependent reductase (Old Yellow Enzyme family)/thioredoxin reductase